MIFYLGLGWSTFYTKEPHIKYVGEGEGEGGGREFLWGPWNILGIYW